MALSKKVPMATYVRRAGLNLSLDFFFLASLGFLSFGAGGLVMGMVVAGTMLALLALLVPSKATLKALRAEPATKSLPEKCE